MFNLDEMEREMILYKTMKKNFFPTYSVLEKSAYHLIVAISVELSPILSIVVYVIWVKMDAFKIFIFFF